VKHSHSLTLTHILYQIEKRPNGAGTAIIAMVVEGSQADRAGLKRGDMVCLAGTNGEEEIMYNMFIDMAASNQRPLVFDIRRIETKSSGTIKNSSAEAFNRKQAVIAAAEAREKAAKRLEKPVKRAIKKVDVIDLNADISNVPQSEEVRRAVEAAKRGESDLAAELGYNPYETNKSTAGQARNATVATKHGSVDAGGGASTPIPNVAAPKEAMLVADEVPPVSPRFQQAFEECVTTSEHSVVVSSFGILRKLLANATTKGQVAGADSDKFRKVRLSNAKIRAAITDVHGALDIMMACGFLLLAEDDGESYLAYPPGNKGPAWLSRALQQLQQYESS
jgi:hypothetical protein